MRLTEETAVPVAALPLEALRQHLRLGSGFALADRQDRLLEGYLRAAIAAIEGRIAKALIRRRFLLEMEGWRDAEAQALPLAPVSALVSIELVTALGAAQVLSPALYRLIQDQHRPRIAGTGAAMPCPPQGGLVRVAFEAGFGPDWAAVPADLQQAVMLLAAAYYEFRHEGAGQAGAQGAGLPAAVEGLIGRWRLIRVLGGGRR
ncbi:hypothetical protein HOY34_09150 [Xinfangfangia sp. D13-10-4-6]|uniref:head-tail connector protein n=1 Tax=Pseudogemmobacter hezensis TaxID=2737662 RepID=UPI0015540A5F|nr:hypothetical protein [Pseudogemmobacter hezensis]NPD15364.1 hypothetical protein [Pseudogemmobacter hezensis]